MKIAVLDTPKEMGAAAAEVAAEQIRTAIARDGHASIIVATGASQFETLAALVAAADIDWNKVTGFHLDEYIGLSADHPASFRKYLKERFVDLLPLKEFHYVNGEVDSVGECERLGKIIKQHSIAVALIGIGENAHLAFNDPPADFETEVPYLTVELDEACRRQQHGEGWFETFDDVPTHAISMSVRHLLKSATIVCSVPDERKANAVAGSVNGEVTPEIPASILQQHADTHLFLDAAAASQLVDETEETE